MCRERRVGRPHREGALETGQETAMGIVTGWHLILTAAQGGVPFTAPCDPLPAPVPVLVVVRDAANGSVLPNVELVDTTTRQVHGRSDREGRIRASLARAPACYRVRQIGYQPSGLHPPEGRRIVAGDTLTILMNRAAFALEELTVLSGSGCPGSSPGSGGTAAWLLDQVQLAASTYEGFVEEWPFAVRIERKTSSRRPSGTYALREERERVESRRWREEYRPGQVVRSNRMGFSVPIFFVTLLGDQSFLENHCFRYDSLGTVDGAPFRILSFTPAPSLTKTDWAGRILLDPESGILRQIRFELVNLEGFRSLARFEGTTTFREVSPFVVIPDSTLAWWWRTEERARERNNLPDVVQQLKVTELKFRDDKRPPVVPSG